MNTVNDMRQWLRASQVKLGLPGAILPHLRSEVSQWRAAAVQEFNVAMTRTELDGVVAYKRSNAAEDWQVVVEALSQIQAGQPERRAEWVARLQEQLSLMAETLPAGGAADPPGDPRLPVVDVDANTIKFGGVTYKVTMEFARAFEILVEHYPVRVALQDELDERHGHGIIRWDNAKQAASIDRKLKALIDGGRGKGGTTLKLPQIPRD